MEHRCPYLLDHILDMIGNSADDLDYTHQRKSSTGSISSLKVGLLSSFSRKVVSFLTSAGSVNAIINKGLD
jgi:hypothetical protein